MGNLKKYLLVIHNTKVWERWKKVLKKREQSIEQGLNQLVEQDVQKEVKKCKKQ